MDVTDYGSFRETAFPFSSGFFQKPVHIDGRRLHDVIALCIPAPRAAGTIGVYFNAVAVRIRQVKSLTDCVIPCPSAMPFSISLANAMPSSFRSGRSIAKW